MPSPRIVVRADASTEIGSGHIRRCLSLSQALRSVGAEVLLLTRDLGADVSGPVRASGIAMEVLPRPEEGFVPSGCIPHEHWARVPWNVDAQQTSEICRRFGANCIVVDHYAFDAQWHRFVRDEAGVSVVVIDDLADRRLDAQMVVDHNYSSDHRRKYQGRVGDSTRILGGPRFALLAEQYATAPRYQFSEHVRSIGIFMGGFDAPNWSGTVLRACRESAGFAGVIEIATTSTNPNSSSLQELAARWPDTKILLDQPSLSAFFASHDLQIGAGGGATWERCCIGSPSLVLACADNQKEVIAELEALGAVEGVDAGEGAIQEAIGRSVRMLLADAARRRSLHQRALSIVDGRGCVRVALAMCRDRLRVRDARLEDADLILRWRNHPAVRGESRNQEPIDGAAHVRWLKSVLSDTDRRLYIGMIGSVPVGVLRYDGINGTDAEVSIYLDPDLHGLGLGPRLLDAGEHVLRSAGARAHRLVATVLETNRRSQRLFENGGYSPIAADRFVKSFKT